MPHIKPTIKQDVKYPREGVNDVTLITDSTIGKSLTIKVDRDIGEVSARRQQ
jgi:hypothetical protein